MGVRVTGSDVAITGNDIGTAAGGDAGTPALRNDTGIWIESGANVLVGGEVPLAAAGGACDDACNVLSNNFAAGVVVDRRERAVAGNHIGVTRSGTAALGNTIAGVSHRSRHGGDRRHDRRPSQRRLGERGERDRDHIHRERPLTVQSNYLGTAADGPAPAPNGGAGIHVATGATIGGPGAAANRIARNIGDGVFVAPEATGATTVLENEIFANGQLGIDLGVADEPAPGVTPNDAGDADAGANSLQNFPLLTAAARGFGGSPGARRSRQSGRLVHAAGYANDACDPSATARRRIRRRGDSRFGPELLGRRARHGVAPALRRS